MSNNGGHNGRKQKRAEEIEKALVDIMDGNSAWYEIQAMTGLDDARCKELEKICNDCISRAAG